MSLRKRSESTRLKKINVVDPGNNIARTMYCNCASGDCSCARDWMDKDTYMSKEKMYTMMGSS
jgi:hypothetical protein